MPITVSIDRERRTASYVVSGPVTGEEFLAFMTQTRTSRPELADYDAICDVTAYTGDVTADHMASVATLMDEARAADLPARTALVANDIGFSDWARVMNLRFDGRKIRMFSSAVAAAAWIRGVQQGREAA